MKRTHFYDDRRPTWWVTLGALAAFIPLIFLASITIALGVHVDRQVANECTRMRDDPQWYDLRPRPQKWYQKNCTSWPVTWMMK